jgi:dTDP-4-amino-4,6-dideoxygalactose transaminase
MAFIEKEGKKLFTFRAKRKFTSSARSAMLFILLSKIKYDHRGILLPAYIGLSKIEGSGVFDPIRKSQIDYCFYRVNKYLIPDLDDLEEKLSSGKFQLVFLIHYFGLPQTNVEKFVELCHKYKVQVIEDCAHTLLGGLEGQLLGRYGDYSIFSIHKSISTLDGGFLIDNTDMLDTSALPEDLKISPDTLAEFANTDIASSSKSRLNNYIIVREWLKTIPQLEPFFKELPLGAVPLNCPVIVSEGKREEFYFKLVQRGILPTALYHTLIPEICPIKFPDSYFISNNILNLPTHPDILESDLFKYEKNLREITQEIFK